MDTASILASLHAPAKVVAAGLIHSIYARGDFGSWAEGISDAKRKQVRPAVGKEVEEYVYRFTTMQWNSQTMPTIDRGNYYSLDKAGTDIWSFIERSATQSEVVEVITQRYNGSRVEIENAVVQLIGELQQEELIVPQAQETESAKKIDMQIETIPETERLSFEAPILQKYTDMQDLLLLAPIREVDETGWPSRKLDAVV